MVSVLVLLNWDWVKDTSEYYFEEYHEEFVDFNEDLLDSASEKILSLKDEYVDEMADFKREIFEKSVDAVDDLRDEYEDDVLDYSHELLQSAKENVDELVDEYEDDVYEVRDKITDRVAEELIKKTKEGHGQLSQKSEDYLIDRINSAREKVTQ